MVKTKADKAQRVTPIKLNMVESHKLVGLLLEDFTDKRMTYGDYAKYATEKLGFPVLPAHVAGRVKEFEIPHGDRIPAPDPSEFTAMLLKHEAQITELFERLAKLEVWINATFPTTSGRKIVN
jgi:hypothetical protein